MVDTYLPDYMRVSQVPDGKREFSSLYWRRTGDQKDVLSQKLDSVYEKANKMFEKYCPGKRRYFAVELLIPENGNEVYTVMNKEVGGTMSLKEPNLIGVSKWKNQESQEECLKCFFGDTAYVKLP